MCKTRMTMKGIFALVALLTFAVMPSAKADKFPVNCAGSSGQFGLFIQAADQLTDLTSQTLVPCELVYYTGQVKPFSGSGCDLEGGTLIITTPDGVQHSFTGIPRLTQGDVFTSAPVAYTVNQSGGSVTAHVTWSGIVHNSDSDPIGGGGDFPLTNPVGTCDDGDPCTVDTCNPDTIVFNDPTNPALGFRQGACEHTDLCTDVCAPCVGGVCTPLCTDPCIPCVEGVCTAVSCPDPCIPCVEGVCTAVSCPDPCIPCVGGVCTAVVCPDPCSPCVGGTCTAVSCPDPCFPCVNGACDTVTHCGNTGCTPGFFKNCVRSWPSCATPTTSLASAGFVINCGCTTEAGANFITALGFKGGSTTCGAIQILMRAAAAAYLNSCFGGYPLSTAQVVAEVNTALATCDRATILAEATKLDGFNNLGCKDANGVDRRCLR